MAHAKEQIEAYDKSLLPVEILLNKNNFNDIIKFLSVALGKNSFSVYLYGSYAYEEAESVVLTNNSATDVDLLVVSELKIKTPYFVTPWIDLLFLTTTEYSLMLRKRDPVVTEPILNGKLLCDHLNLQNLSPDLYDNDLVSYLLEKSDSLITSLPNNIASDISLDLAEVDIWTIVNLSYALTYRLYAEAYYKVGTTEILSLKKVLALSEGKAAELYNKIISLKKARNYHDFICAYVEAKSFLKNRRLQK